MKIRASKKWQKIFICSWLWDVKICKQKFVYLFLLRYMPFVYILNLQNFFQFWVVKWESSVYWIKPQTKHSYFPSFSYAFSTRHQSQGLLPILCSFTILIYRLTRFGWDRAGWNIQNLQFESDSKKNKLNYTFRSALLNQLSYKWILTYSWVWFNERVNPFFFIQKLPK